MNLLHRRGWLLVGTAALFAGGLLGVACGPNKNNGDGGVDGGGDSTNPGDSGGGDGSKPDGSKPDGGSGSCEAGIGGNCDIVAQNCGSGQECAVVQTDGGDQLQCIPNTSGSITEGYACTPSNQKNPCVAGLECILNRCAKHCCFGDDSACGKSVPEGFAGRCDLTITVGNINAYTACTYSAGCQPFEIQPCTASQTCNIKDSNGTAVCIDYASTDGGLPEKTPCTYANDCKDGLICAGNLDGGAAICQWECYVPPGPFDAGITSLGAGKGGCPTGESCKPINWGGTAPTWLGMCGK